MKKYFFNPLILLVLVFPIYLTFFANKKQIEASGITFIKDQLSSAQLSYFGRIGETINNTTIDIATSGNPSNSTINLSVGDSIAIADPNGGSTKASVISITDNDTLSFESDKTVTTMIGGYIIAIRSATHTISFIPDYAGSNTTLMFLIKGTNLDGESPTDGIPDQDGFDLGTLTTSDVICPDGSEADAVGEYPIPSGLLYSGYYHTILCSGINITQGVGISAVIGKESGGQLINPSPSRNHTIGQANTNADTYWYSVLNFDGDGNQLGINLGKIAVTENVRVTATVDSILTFTIGTSNVTTVGTTLCGNPLDTGAPNTTATSVNFGLLSLATSNNLAQKLSCVTNSINGYIIQTYENRPLQTITGEIIPNTDCGGNSCSSTIERPWTTFTTSGFGYSLEVGTTTGNPANISIGITTLGNYKAFGVGSSNAESLWSRTDTPSATDSLYICYRAVAGSGQGPGYYDNSISFIATATF